jgi:chemotaxis protein methyltransferase CheR
MELEEVQLHEFLNKLYLNFGYDFRDYAQASLKRRICHYLQLKKVNSLSELWDNITSDNTALEQMIQEISVTVTEMFRDPSFFKSLNKHVIPRLKTYPFFKVWVAGCATGEEAYTIAIILKEAGLLERSIIYATDINQRSLRKAADGIFPIDSMKNYITNYQQYGGLGDFSQYYSAKYNSVMMNKELSKNMVFAPHNLAVDSAFNEFELIICRNVLIYFNQTLQNKVINLFYQSLCDFGYLGLGSKESLLFTDKRKEFTEIDRKEKLFMKTAK